MRCAPALLTVSRSHSPLSGERPAAIHSGCSWAGSTYPSSEMDIFRISEVMRCFLPLSACLVHRTTAETVAFAIALECDAITQAAADAGGGSKPLSLSNVVLLA